MGYYDERSDGLLRGSRSDRINAMLELRDAEWNIGTFLVLLRGALDHAYQVNHAALEAVTELARRSPEPFTVSPVTLLGRMLSAGLPDPGKAGFDEMIEAWEVLFELRTPEADGAIETELIEPAAGVPHDDFERIVTLALEKGRRDVLRRLLECDLPKKKASIVRRLAGASGDSVDD